MAQRHQLDDLQRQLDELQAEMAATRVQVANNQQSLAFRMGRAVAGGESYPTTGQQFYFEPNEIAFPASVGDQVRTLTKRQPTDLVCRNLAGTIPTENSDIYAFRWKDKWMTYAGVTQKTPIVSPLVLWYGRYGENGFDWNDGPLTFPIPVLDSTVPIVGRVFQDYPDFDTEYAAGINFFPSQWVSRGLPAQTPVSQCLIRLEHLESTFGTPGGGDWRGVPPPTKTSSDYSGELVVYNREQIPPAPLPTFTIISTTAVDLEPNIAVRWGVWEYDMTAQFNAWIAGYSASPNNDMVVALRPKWSAPVEPDPLSPLGDFFDGDFLCRIPPLTNFAFTL